MPSRSSRSSARNAGHLVERLALDLVGQEARAGLADRAAPAGEPDPVDDAVLDAEHQRDPVAAERVGALVGGVGVLDDPEVVGPPVVLEDVVAVQVVHALRSLARTPIPTSGVGIMAVVAPRCVPAPDRFPVRIGTKRRPGGWRGRAMVVEVPVTTISSYPRLLASPARLARRGSIPRRRRGDRLLADLTAWLRDDVPRRRAGRPRAPGRCPAATRASPSTCTRRRRDVVLDGRRRRPGHGLAARPAMVGSWLSPVPRAAPRAARRRVRDRRGRRTAPGRDAFADRATVERRYLDWLGPTLARRRAVVRRRGASAIHLGHRRRDRYVVDGAAGDRARSARRCVARGGHRRPARRARPHALVGRRDRRPLPAQSSARPPVARRALAAAGARWAKRELLDEVHRLLGRAFADRSGPRHPVARLGRDRRAARHRRRDGAPGRSMRPRARRPSDVPIGYRRAAGHASATPAGRSRSPGAFAERRDRGRVVGRRRRAERDAGRDETGTDRGSMTGRGVPRPGRGATSGRKP